MAVVLQLSIQLGYGLFFAVAALACLMSVTRALSVEDQATRQGLSALLITSGLWATTYLGVLFSSARIVKEMWYTVGLVVGFGTVFAWLYFCSAYTDRIYHQRQRYQYAGLALYAGVVGIKLTNPYHGLYFSSRMVESPFPHLAIQHGAAHWVATGLAYVLAAVGMFMLFESFTEAGYDTRSLVGLTGLTAIPVGLDLVAYESTAVIDIIYAPLGVAVFAVGVLFVARDRFLAVQVTGNIPEPVVFLDDDERVREYNDSANELFPALSRAVGQPISLGTPFDGTLSGQDIIKVDGEPTRYFLVNATSLASTQSSMERMLVFVDVTRLERQRRELERHNDQLEDISAGIRHELLNSLQVVGGRLSVAGTALENGDINEARNRLETVSQRADEMETVVDGLSTLARHGQTVDQLEPIRIDAVVADAQTSVDSDQLNVTVANDAAIAADWTRLHELLESLLRFLADNGSTNVRIEATEDGLVAETDWSLPEGLDEEQLFEYTGGLTDTKNGLALPKLRTLARVQGWTVALDRTAAGSRIIISDARIRINPDETDA